MNRVRGWEIHPGAANDARNAVAAYLSTCGYTQTQATAAALRIVINKDFLTQGPPDGEFQIIAGNPPYLRFQRLPEYFKALYGDYLPSYARGDLLHAFLDSCTSMINANGVIALICSDRFLFNDTAANLRAKLGTRVGISHLARLDQATAFYRPKNRVRNSPPRIHPVEIILQSNNSTTYPLTREPISPDNPGAIPDTGPTLCSIAKVSLAPWLGPAGIFTIPTSLATHFKAHNIKLVSAVDTDDIDPKTDVLKPPTRFAILTSRDVVPDQLLLEHFQSLQHKMPPRGKRSPCWLPPETINLSLDQPSLLIPRIARRLRAIDLPAGIIPINHNLSIISSSSHSLQEIKKILLSDKSQTWIQNNAPKLESGYYSITTKLLRRLPL